MKGFILIGASLIFEISCFILWKTWEKKIIQEKGIKVTAQVIEAPKKCENQGRRPPYSKIKYNGKIFVKKLSGDLCYLVINKQNVSMLTNKKGDILLFEKEYDPIQFVYGVFMIILCIVMVIRVSLKKK